MAKLKADSDRGSIYSEALAEAVTAIAGLVTKILASNKQAEEEATESSFLFTFEGSKDNAEDKVAHEVRKSMRPSEETGRPDGRAWGDTPSQSDRAYHTRSSAQSTSPQ